MPNTKASPTVSTVYAQAPLIQLVYQSQDLEAFTIVSATAATVTVTNQPGKSSGLDTGDKAAIGVGVVGIILLIACIVLGWLLLRRRRREKAWSEPAELPNQDGHGFVAEKRQSRREMDGTALNELDNPTAELPEQSTRK